MLLIEIILTLIKYFFMSGADLLQRTVLNVVSASDIVLASSAKVPGSIPSQGQCHAKDVIKRMTTQNRQKAKKNKKYRIRLVSIYHMYTISRYSNSPVHTNIT